MERNDDGNRIFRSRLTALMEYFGLTNASLAKAIGVDSSLISRWRTGSRSVAGNPEYAALIARYVVPRIASPADRTWMKKQMVRDLGVTETEIDSNMAQHMARWLYPGRARLMEQPKTEDTAVLLVSSFAEAISADNYGKQRITIDIPNWNQSGVVAAVGEQQVEKLLRHCLDEAEAEGDLLIYLSSESIRSIRHAGVVATLKSASAEKELRVCMLVQSANNTAASSELLATYMPMLVTGRLLLLVTQGVPQSMLGTWGVLVPNRAALTVNETLSGESQPFATIITGEQHLTDIRMSFERSKRFARPLMTMMDDRFARNIIEIFFSGIRGAGQSGRHQKWSEPTFFRAGRL